LNEYISSASDAAIKARLRMALCFNPLRCRLANPQIGPFNSFEPFNRCASFKLTEEAWFKSSTVPFGWLRA
jgi:hypothetical protein